MINFNLQGMYESYPLNSIVIFIPVMVIFSFVHGTVGAVLLVIGILSKKKWKK